MIELICKHIYTFFMVTLGVSLVLILFMHGETPLNILLSWSDDGSGEAMVFTVPKMNASLGDNVVKSGAFSRSGEVDVFVVKELLRRDGTLYYRALNLNSDSENIETIPARELNRSILFSVPFFGFLVKMLNTTIGIMTLVVLPIMMLVINAIIVLFYKFIPFSFFDNNVFREVNIENKHKVLWHA